MKPNNAIKLDFVRLAKTHSDKNVLLKMVYSDIMPANKLEAEKDKLHTLSRVKKYIGQTDPQKSQVTVFCIT